MGVWYSVVDGGTYGIGNSSSETGTTRGGLRLCWLAGGGGLRDGGGGVDTSSLLRDFIKSTIRMQNNFGIGRLYSQSPR